MFKKISISLVVLFSIASFGCEDERETVTIDGAINILKVWTGWTSEEYEPVVCADEYATNGFSCYGPYCDQVRLKCENTGRSTGDVDWNTFISEEGSPISLCDYGSYVTGINCNGAYCDKVSIACTEFTGAGAYHCTTTAWISEEAGGTLYFGDYNGTGNKYFARSVQCKGPYCDQMRFQICTMIN